MVYCGYGDRRKNCTIINNFIELAIMTQPNADLKLFIIFCAIDFVFFFVPVIYMLKNTDESRDQSYTIF